MTIFQVRHKRQLSCLLWQDRKDTAMKLMENVAGVSVSKEENFININKRDTLRDTESNIV